MAPAVTEDEGRAQDQGRRHRRAGRPSAATVSLLADYQAAMRDELRAVLVELRGKLPEPGLGMVAPEPVRPSLRDRMALWDLGIKLGRELGSEVDVKPPTVARDRSGAPRRRRVDFG